jgi:dUTP pyrophosphatase
MSSFPDLQVKLLTKTAKLPTRSHDTDAGLDLYADELVMVAKRGQATISTGIAIGLPPNTMGKIFSRSGLASKQGIIAEAGVIDESYSGNVMVCLFNLTDKDYYAEPGTKIAQLIIIPVYYSSVKQVEKLTETDRGAAGFGSTDLKVDAVKPKTKKEANSNKEVMNMLEPLLKPMLENMSGPGAQPESQALGNMMQQMLGIFSQVNTISEETHEKSEPADKVD